MHSHIPLAEIGDMTLVVARRIQGRIYMVGDTKFTPESAGSRDGQSQYLGGLKIVGVHPGVAIAFAHNTVSAQRAIEGIHSSGLNLFDKNEVLNYFLGHHLQSLQQGAVAMVEFIAAFVLNDGVSELFLIKNGSIELVDAGYIGETAAYNSFLYFERQLVNEMPETLPLDVALRALDMVIRDVNPSTSLVDGFTIGLRQSPENGFCYVHRLVVEGRSKPVNEGPMAPVTFGGAPEGANEWSIGSSPGDALGVLTAYCHTASFGVIYRPALKFEHRIVRGCTFNSLIDASMEEVNQIVSLLDKL